MSIRMRSYPGRSPVMAAWARTRECARILRARTILFQCPASFKPTDENVENMRRFFAEIERMDGVDFVWEPRGPWPDDAWKGWWGDEPPYHVPTFVLTHYARAPIQMKGGTEFRFVTDGIHSALRARCARGHGPRLRHQGALAVAIYAAGGRIRQ